MFSLLDESLRVANGMSSVWPHVDSFYASRTLVPPLISVAELGGSSMVRVCSPSYLLISEQLTYTLDNLSFFFPERRNQRIAMLVRSHFQHPRLNPRNLLYLQRLLTALRCHRGMLA